eukprot:gene420-2211_t
MKELREQMPKDDKKEKAAAAKQATKAGGTSRMCAAGGLGEGYER